MFLQLINHQIINIMKLSLSLLRYFFCFIQLFFAIIMNFKQRIWHPHMQQIDVASLSKNARCLIKSGADWKNSIKCWNYWRNWNFHKRFRRKDLKNVIHRNMLYFELHDEYNCIKEISCKKNLFRWSEHALLC